MRKAVRQNPASGDASQKLQVAKTVCEIKENETIQNGKLSKEFCDDPMTWVCKKSGNQSASIIDSDCHYINIDDQQSPHTPGIIDARCEIRSKMKQLCDQPELKGDWEKCKAYLNKEKPNEIRKITTETIYTPQRIEKALKSLNEVKSTYIATLKKSKKLSEEFLFSPLQYAHGPDR